MKMISSLKLALAAVVLATGMAAFTTPASADVVIVNGRHGYYDGYRHFHPYSYYHGNYGYWHNNAFIVVRF